MTPEEFKRIQKKLGYSNKKMGYAMSVSEKAVEKWRAGDRQIMPYCRRLLSFLLYFREVLNVDPLDIKEIRRID
jgi:DNA-binding transcriptional regulator YiaG